MEEGILMFSYSWNVGDDDDLKLREELMAKDAELGLRMLNYLRKISKDK